MKTTFYTAAAKVRRGLNSDIFQPGKYAPRDIIQTLIEHKFIDPWDVNNQTLRDQLQRHPKWVHAGGTAMGSRWERVPNKVKVAAPQPLAPKPVEESERGPVAQRLVRIETMLEALCANLGIHANGVPR